MKSFELTVLGSNSAMPAYGRFPTSQVLRLDQHLFLIDCGEGCQIRMGQYKIKRNRISNILISHLHGDHVYGLPGLIGSMNHLSRTNQLHIFGPVGLADFLNTCFRTGQVVLNFDIRIQELDHAELKTIVDHEDYYISAFPTDHRIPCYGYRFHEKTGEYNIRKEAIREYNLSVDEIKLAKKGKNIPRGNNMINYSIVTHPQALPRSYTYCADSRPNQNLIPFIKGSDLLYFEATYLDELRDQANERGHSTALQAARMADLAGAKNLLIGHYSSRYKDPKVLLEEARSLFASTTAAQDGTMILIGHKTS